MGMLALTMKAGDTVFIGDDILVKLHKVRGDKITIGFAAPPDVSIDRECVRLRKIAEAQAKAADAAPSAPPAQGAE